MFFEMLAFWFAVGLFYHQTITQNRREALFYALATVLSCSVLASLKPSFLLTSLLILGSVGLLVVNRMRSVDRIIIIGWSAGVILAVIAFQQFFSRGDDVTKRFLPQTLFAFHANIIDEQMRTDLERGAVPFESRAWLQTACDNLENEIRHTRSLYPNAYRRLGYQADYLVSAPDALLARWRSELGERRYLEFLGYWYRHSLVRRPLEFARKIALQMAVFYSPDCPTFNARRRLSLNYSASLEALSNPKIERLLAKSPAGVSFMERTQHLQSTNDAIEELRIVHLFQKLCGRTYLALLVFTLAVAGWFFLKDRDSAGGLPPALLALGFYGANFGNVLGISIVHSMEVWRYSGVQFIAALFAYFWAIRWLIEVALAKWASVMRTHTCSNLS